MSYNFCPNCGQKTLTKHDATHYSCASCKQDIYNNPKATVAVIFLKDGKALFSKRGIEPNKGKYDFPGGFLEYAEDPYDACIREIAEETGLTIKAENLTLLTANSQEYVPDVSVTDMIFVITEWNGDFTAADDSAALEWKPVAFIENDQFAPKYTGLVTKLQNFS